MDKEGPDIAGEASDNKPQRKRKRGRPSKKVKDDLGPATGPVDKEETPAKVIVVWRDDKGRERTTSYVIHKLTLREDTSEDFSSSGRKTTRIFMSLEGDVLEKM
jgi:hypothetical protein